MRLPPPRATQALVAVTSLCWLLSAVSPAGNWLPVAAGFIPARANGVFAQSALPMMVPFWLTPVTAALLHGSLMHLAFNMVVLGYCGRLVEAALGVPRFLLLFLLGCYAAALGQWLSGPASPVPMIGASGAVSAIIAAQALLFGGRAGAGRSFASRLLQALWLAAAWIAIQGLTELALGSSIAVAAHVGGFLAGLILAVPLIRSRRSHA